jgi:RNA recognition motif-containing protein
MNNKIFIKNLSANITEPMLEEFLSGIGSAKSIAIFKEKKFVNPGKLALIEMDSKESAEAAIKKLNGIILDGVDVNVIKANPIEIPEDEVE